MYKVLRPDRHRLHKAGLGSKSSARNLLTAAQSPCGIFACFALLYLVTQVPLYAVRYPDIVDFPNHAARLYVLLHIDESPVLRDFYVAQPGLAPNLALDVLGPPLARVLGVELGLKAFASICTLLITTGTLALGIAMTDRSSFLSLGALLFAQNAFAHLGLFNFLFGTGLALWLLAAWIFARRRGFVDSSALAAFAVCATSPYLCHLSAIGIYIVGLIAFEFAREGSDTFSRRIARLAYVIVVQVAPALVIHALAYEPGSNLASPFPNSTISAFVAYKAALAFLVPTICFHTLPGIERSNFGFDCDRGLSRTQTRATLDFTLRGTHRYNTRPLPCSSYRHSDSDPTWSICELFCR